MFEFPMATSSMLDKLKREEESWGEKEVDEQAHADTMAQSLDSAMDMGCLGDADAMPALENASQPGSTKDEIENEEIEMDDALYDHLGLQAASLRIENPHLQTP